MLPHIPQSVTPKKDPGRAKTTKNQSDRPGRRREDSCSSIDLQNLYIGFSPRLQTFLEDVSNAKRLHSSLDYVPAF